MLILTRKKKQAVVLDLGDGRIVKVVVVDTGRSTRLGFAAPESVKIYREDYVPEEKLPKWYREMLAKAEAAQAEREAAAV